MELCDRIPMNPREADIVRNELQNPTLVNTRTERPIPKLMYSYTSCAFRRVRSTSYSLIKRSPTADTIRSRAADSASFHQDCEVKSRSCVLLPRCNDTQIQKNLVCGHVNSKFRLQESDDEIPPTCKSRRNPRMLALRTPSRSLLDCPLNWCIRIGSWSALT